MILSDYDCSMSLYVLPAAIPSPIDGLYFSEADRGPCAFPCLYPSTFSVKADLSTSMFQCFSAEQTTSMSTFPSLSHVILAVKANQLASASGLPCFSQVIVVQTTSTSCSFHHALLSWWCVFFSKKNWIIFAEILLSVPRLFKPPETTAQLSTLLSLALTGCPLGHYPSNFFAPVGIVLGISCAFRWHQTVKNASRCSYLIHERWRTWVAHIEGEFPVIILPECSWYGRTPWHRF